MDIAQDLIAADFRIGDDADRQQIQDLLKPLVLRHHLLIDAVQMLAAAEDPIRHDAMRMQHIADLIDHILDLRIAF